MKCNATEKTKIKIFNSIAEANTDADETADDNFERGFNWGRALWITGRLMNRNQWRRQDLFGGDAPDT